MKLNFYQIDLANFKSFAGEHTLDLASFGIGLNFLRGRNLAEPSLGSNGSGKTSILPDPLSYVLFGQTLDGLHNPDVTPWRKDDGKTSIGLGIQIDGTNHVLTRSISPNRLLLDDEVLSTEDLTAKTGLSMALFAHTVVLGQGQPLFFDLSPRDKMELFTDALDLSRWDDRSAAAGRYASDLSHKLSDENGSLRAKRENIETFKYMLKTAEQKAAAWDQDRRDSLKHSERELAALKKEYEGAERNRIASDLAFDGTSTELKDIIKKRDAMERQISQYEQNNKAEQRKLDQLATEQMDLESQLASLNKAKTCPMCKQPLKSPAQIKQHQDQINTKINETIRTIKNETLQIEAIDKLVIDLKKQLSKFSKQYDEFSAKRDKAQNDLEILTTSTGRLSAQIKVIENALNETTVNPHASQVRDLKKRIKENEDAIAAAEAEINKLQRAIERATFWVRGFKNVRLYIIDDIMGQLEAATNAMLPEIGLHDWYVHFDVEKQTKAGTIKPGLNVEIMSPTHDKPVKWESFSGGEAQRLRIIGALALRDVLLAHAGIECNLEVIDEGTQHLSRQGVRDLCHFLANRAKQNKRQIWMIDHVAREGLDFTSTLTIVKDKTGSHVED